MLPLPMATAADKIFAGNDEPADEGINSVINVKVERWLAPTAQKRKAG